MNRFVFILTLIFFPIIGFTQERESEKIDSLLTLLKTEKDEIKQCDLMTEIASYSYMKNVELGIRYSKKALELSTKIKYKKGTGNAYLELAKCTSMTGKYDESLNLYAKSLKIFTELKDACSQGLVFLNQGAVYGNLSKFPNSLDAFFKAVKLFEGCEGTSAVKNRANAFQNIGNIYNLTESYDKALVNYDKAIQLFDPIKDSESSKAILYSLKGLVYEKKTEFQKAIELHNLAETILLKHRNSTSLAFVRNWKGKAHLGLKQYDLSIQNSNSALATAKKLGDQELLASTYQNIGISYLKKAEKTNSSVELDSAYLNLKHSLQIHNSTHNQEELSRDYRFLSEYFDLKKDFKNSLEMHKLFSVYNDSVYNFKNKQSLQNLEDEQTIEFRDKEIKLNKLSLKAKERESWFYIIGIGLLLTIGGLLFYQSQNRKKSNDKLLKLNSELDIANQTKLRFLGILNHDLRSPVSKLIQFLQLQKENPDFLDRETKERWEHKTISSAENLLDSMEDLLFWTKGQMDNFHPVLKSVYLTDIFEDIQKHFYGFSERIEYDIPTDVSFKTDENYLKTILRNLTNNAIKATEDVEFPKVNWKAKAENQQIILCISDNGKGADLDKFNALFDQNESIGVQSGLGLHLVRDLAEKINCEIEVYSELGQGTKFVLKLPK